MKQLNKWQNAIFMISALLMVAGAGTWIFKWPYFPHVYSVGAIGYACMQMLQRYEGRNFIIRRLRRQQILGLIAFLCAACCMIMQTFRFGFARRNEWVVCLAIGCVLLLYTAFRIPAELKKEENR